MKPALKLSLTLALALGAGTANAQLYKWVGPDGKVSYSDTPPPASAVRAERKAVTASGAGGAGLPYEVAEAARNSPVTLYVGGACAPCDDGRRMLNERGIPFSEKIVKSNDEIIRLKQLGGDAQLPLLTVGRNKQQGFEPDAWGATLSAAGYPATSQLPKTWRNAPAEPLIPVVQAAAPATAAPVAPAPASPDTPPAASGNAPPGFRF